MSKHQLGEMLQAAPGGQDAAAPTLSLSGKVALITGASSGIGRAIALAYAAAGADVALGYRSNRRGAEETAEQARAAGHRADPLQADIAESRDVDALADALRRAFGRVDVWINNAGADILTGATASLSWTEKLDRLLAVDLRGTVLASWKAVELMRAQPSGGVILNMSWDHVLAGGMKGEYAQAAAPHIRVNVLGPGWIETAYGSALPESVKQRITKSIPLGRWGTPEDIAHAAVYLASDAARYVTGQMLAVNGGSVV